MADAKIIRRVENLLRLARPDANTSDHERASAALEAAKLFAEHDLVVRDKNEAPVVPPPRKRARPKPPPSRPQSWVVTKTVYRNGAPPDTSRYEAAPNPFEDSRRPPPGWMRSIAARDGVCADPDCRGAIERGEPVWMRGRGFEIEYLHVDGPCDW